MTHIHIDIFDVKSIKDAEKELTAYSEEFKKKVDELMSRLSELARATAISRYAEGVMDGNTDVTVSIEPIEHGFVLRADGEDVYFLEFGTGTAAGQGYDTSVIAPPVSIEPWSWAGKDSKTAERGYWFYDGVKYFMTVPTMGMYHAVKEVETQLQQIANEVFGS